MPRSSLVRLAPLALATACALNGSLRASADALPQAQTQPAPAPNSTAAASAVFDLDFPGGTVEEYLAHVRARSGQPSVVVLSPELNAMRMQPVKVARVSMGGAVRIVEALPTPTTASPPFRIRLSGTGTTLPGEQMVWILSLEHAPTKPPQPVDAPQVSVLRLAEIMNAEGPDGLDEEKVDTLLEAIGIGVAMLSETTPSSVAEETRRQRLIEYEAGLAPAPSRSEVQSRTTFEIKLHKRSGLLFLRGTEREIMLAHEVIANLAN